MMKFCLFIIIAKCYPGEYIKYNDNRGGTWHAWTRRRMNIVITLEILKKEDGSVGPGHRWYDSLKETVWEIVGQDSDK